MAVVLVLSFIKGMERIDLLIIEPHWANQPHQNGMMLKNGWLGCQEWETKTNQKQAPGIQTQMTGD